MDSSGYMVVVYGPTGVGKTDFVDQLARAIPSEVVNIDMGQMYCPLSIGTAKPDLQDTSVPHHLFDLIDEPRKYTVTAYRELLCATMSEIWSRGNVPLVVGGSAFYMRSLFFPPLHAADGGEIPDADDLWEQLDAVDPERARAINPRDTYRIKRALALYHQVGSKPSLMVPLYNPPASYYMVCLTRDRAQLYARINDRVKQMMDQGWIDEVEQLMDTEWEPFLEDKKIIGYDEIVGYLKYGGEYESLIAAIQKRTRNYAKRQMTFWRMMRRQLEQEIARNQKSSSRCRVEQVNLTSLDLPLYIKQLSKTIKALLV